MIACQVRASPESQGCCSLPALGAWLLQVLFICLVIGMGEMLLQHVDKHLLKIFLRKKMQLSFRSS